MDETRKAAIVENWMTNSTESDVQTAIQSQTIQTVLENQTSALTDVAFRSFLANAPIPRVFLIQQTNLVLVNAVAGFIQWGTTARYHDPYAMNGGVAEEVIIPVDGYYTFYCNISNVLGGVAAGFNTYLQAVSVKSKVYGAGVQLALNGSWVPVQSVGGTTGLNLNFTMPFEAGDTLRFAVFENSGVGLTYVSGYCGAAWVAPYKQYTGGN